MSGMAWWRHAGARARHRGRSALSALIVAAVALATPLLGALPAAGETGTPGGPTGAGCPSSNPPTTLTLIAGTPQTATLGSGFESVLQVALENGDGCPVTGAAGTPVTFSAPSTGAGGLFSTSGSSTVTVGADASGAVTAPTLSANGIAGGYTVTASSRYGSVSFSLTNSAAGMPARVIAISRTSQSARVTSRYPQPLRVKVLDADGNPVAGATVTFTLSSSTGAGACAAASGAGASFIGAGAEASATTSASGVATSPLFSANSIAGSYAAGASVAQAAGGGPSGSAGSGGSGSGGSGSGGSDEATPASFALANLAGEPAKLTVGVGASQSTMIGGRFAIGLAVTVTDAEKNPVAGALVTFSAPARGASAHFTTRSRGAGAVRSHTSQRRTIVVKTDACGIAVAAPPNANHEQGGYIVRASVGRAVAAAFALVNEAPKPRL
jgi:hypothetical protein